MANKKRVKRNHYFTIDKRFARNVKTEQIRIADDTNLYLRGLPKLEPVFVVGEEGKIESNE